MKYLSVLIVIVFLLFVGTVKGEESNISSVTLGNFEKNREAIFDLFTLNLVDKKLSFFENLDIKKKKKVESKDKRFRNTIGNLKDRIIEKLIKNPKGYLSSGGSSFSFKLYNGKIESLYIEDRKSEVKYSCSKTKKGSLIFEFFSLRNKAIFNLIQFKDGNVVIIFVYKEQHYVFKGNNYLDLLLKNKEKSQKILIPFFKNISLNVTNPFSEKYIAKVLKELSVDSPIKDVATLLKELDSDVKTQREAYKTLEENYLIFRDSLKKAMKTREFSIEVKSQLEDLFKKNDPKMNQNINLASSGVMKSPRYLISLMKNTKGKNLKNLVKRLEKTTNQKHGEDIKSWEKWAEGLTKN